MISVIYENARDVKGENHCFIRYFDPENRIEIVFPGYAGNENRDKFLNKFGLEIPVTGSVRKENQVLSIRFR